MMQSEKNLQDRNRIVLQEFLEYRKKKEVREKLQAMLYYEDIYGDTYYEDDTDSRKYQYE